MEFNILCSSSMQSILENYALVQQERQKAAFNLFTISSSTSHLENFHSDIIATLLDKTAVHQVIIPGKVYHHSAAKGASVLRCK